MIFRPGSCKQKSWIFFLKILKCRTGSGIPRAMKHFLCGDDGSSRPVLVIQDQYRHRGAESDKNDDRRVLLDVISMTAVDDIAETVNTLQQAKLRS